MIFRNDDGQPTAIGRKFEAISTDPDRQNTRERNRRIYFGTRAKRIAAGMGIAVVLSGIAEVGVGGVLGTVDRAAETLLEGSDGTEREGFVAGTAHKIGNAVSNFFTRDGGNSSNSNEVTPMVPAETTVAAAELDGRTCATDVRLLPLVTFVSTAVYDANAAFLPSVGGSETALDPLWANYYSADNNGASANNPGVALGTEVNIRVLTEDPAQTGCIVR